MTLAGRALRLLLRVVRLCLAACRRLLVSPVLLTYHAIQQVLALSVALWTSNPVQRLLVGLVQRIRQLVDRPPLRFLVNRSTMEVPAVTRLLVHLECLLN